MSLCEICKSRHTWDCDDEVGRRKCANFELDLSALDEKDREEIQRLAMAYLMLRGEI